MNKTILLRNCSLAALVAVAIGAEGCASHKYVRQQVDPVSQRLSDDEKKNGDQFEAVNNAASRANERAQGAENRANQAAESASRADQKAERAGQRADQAGQLAQQGLDRTGKLQSMVDNIENYKLASNRNVQFRVNRAELTDEAKTQLDEVAGSLASTKRYVIEVQGYTDKTGGANYNLALSERRASAVIRYLTVEKQVPLRNIRQLGVGTANPVADNTTRQGRAQNRRVEVRIYTPDLNGENTQAQNGSGN